MTDEGRTVAPREHVDVVLVDDSADVRAMVGLRLSRSGRFRVVAEGADGVEAIELARRHRPDLMLLDVSMPRMGGLEALPQIREASPSTRVAMFSGFAADDIAAEALRLGAVDFLEKSTPLPTLVAHLLDAATSAPQTASGSESRAGDEVQVVPSEHLERFREVFDQAAIGMATLTLTGEVVRTNRALTRLLDQHAEDIVGRPYAGFVPATGVPALRAALVEVASGHQVVAQLEHGLGDGDQRVRSTLSAISDQSGRPLYLLLQVEDVTERRRAEAALRRSEDSFRLLVDSVVDYAIFVLDVDGHVVTWNTGAQRIKGYTADEIVGRHFSVFYPPEERESAALQDRLHRAAATGRHESRGWRLRKDGSRFWAHVVLTPLRNEAGEVIAFGKVTRALPPPQHGDEDVEGPAG